MSGGDGGLGCAPRPNTTTTLAQKLCRRVLSTVQDVDGSASITSVSRWDHDCSTLVRVRAGEANGGSPFGIVDALKRAWPLARVSLVENVVEGTTEAQMLMPSPEEQRDIARQQAYDSRLAKRVRLFAKLVTLAAVLSFVILATANASR